MPIQLVQETEKLTYEWEDSKIYYRRIPTGYQNAIVRDNTKKGKVNWKEVNKLFLHYCVLGWDNVQVDEKPIPYTPELSESLPGDIVDDLLEKAGAGNPDGARKNSKSSSSSK